MPALDKKQKLTYGAVIVVIVGAVLTVWAMRGQPNNANFPEGTDWLCLNPACKNHFKLTMHELGEHHRLHYGQPVPCPKCGQRADRAEVCKSCGKVFQQMRGMTNCPYCGKPLAPPAAG
jgi:hypothetical protein